jgi:transposase-like protein
MTRRLDDLDPVAFMVDGVHFGEHTCVVALGIDVDGGKHPLAIEEGSTENTTLVTGLITGLRDPGLDVTRPILALLDGSKALARGRQGRLRQAAHPALPAAQDQECKGQAAGETADGHRAAEQACHACSAVEAEGLLEQLARELARTHPGAAASLREDMAETLTIVRLGVPPTLARTLRSTNPIESMIEICREHSKKVKRWRDGTMALRWCAAGDARSRPPVPSRQRTPPPAQTPRRSGRALQQECQRSLPK